MANHNTLHVFTQSGSAPAVVPATENDLVRRGVQTFKTFHRSEKSSSSLDFMRVRYIEGRGATLPDRDMENETELSCPFFVM